MKKKWIVVTVIIIATLLGVGISYGKLGKKSQANTNIKKTEDGKVIVELWRHYGEPQEDAYLSKLVKEFNNTSKTTFIQETSIPGESYAEQMKAALLTGKMPHLYDIDATEMGGMVYADGLTPLDKYLTPEFKSQMLDSTMYKYDGQTYLAGQFESGLSFWANKTYLEKAGVRIATYENPWTEAEFKDALMKLKTLPGIKYPLDIKVNYGPKYFMYSWLPIVKSFGGDYYDSKTKKSSGFINGPETVKAYELLKWMIDNKYVDATQTSDGDFYLDKDAALSLSGHWMYKSHTDNMGDDVILIPLPDFGKGSWTNSGSFAWGMSPKAVEDGVDKNAWEFMEFILNEKNVKGMVEANGAVPASKELLKNMPQYGEGGLLNLYNKQLSGNKIAVRPVTPAFSTITNELGEAAGNILSGTDIQTALDTAAKRIDQVIEDNQYNK